MKCLGVTACTVSGLAALLIVWPWLIIAGWLLGVGLTGIGLGIYLCFVGNVMMFCSTLSGAACCTNPEGCCSHRTAGIVMVIGAVFDFIALICFAADHARLDEICKENADNPDDCDGLHAAMTYLYIYSVVPAIVGIIASIFYCKLSAELKDIVAKGGSAVPGVQMTAPPMMVAQPVVATPVVVQAHVV